MPGTLPRRPGVYRFRDARGAVLYLGRATDLRSRVASYRSDLGDRRHLAPMVARIARVEAVWCDSVHEAAWLERNLLETRMPRWNRTAGGQEVPVHLVLEATGLRVAHAPGRESFGPYLGGVRTRRAASALHRLYPVAYTADRLTGTARDLAGKRGYGAADRAALTDALTAVLRREPAAVARALADLEGLRDKASAALAFEFAGRLQEELEGLAWITAPQRATVPDSPDHTVSGWSDGILVQLHLRAGRISQWTQRRCTEASARPLLAATAPSWADFAHRNARLAASLQG